MSKTKNEIRDTEFYKSLTPYLATGLCEGFEETDNEDHVIAAWQYLHDKKIAYSLQGWFGRQARNLIDQGIISE